MRKADVEKQCLSKERELLDRYFGNIVTEAVIDRPETLAAGYTKDLPFKIEAEYLEYLRAIWRDYSISKFGKETPLILEEVTLRDNVVTNHRDNLDTAYKNAKIQNLWERITQTNHKDVTYFKGCLKDFTCELLWVMRTDFLEEIED